MDRNPRQWLVTSLKRAYEDAIVNAVRGSARPSVWTAFVKAVFFASTPIALVWLYIWLFQRPDGAAELRSMKVGGCLWAITCVLWFGSLFVASFVGIVRRRAREDFLSIEVGGLLLECISLRQGFAEVMLTKDSAQLAALSSASDLWAAKVMGTQAAYSELAAFFEYVPSPENRVYTVHLEAAQVPTAASRAVEWMDNMSGRLARALLVILKRQDLATVMQASPGHYMRGDITKPPSGQGPYAGACRP